MTPSEPETFRNKVRRMPGYGILRAARAKVRSLLGRENVQWLRVVMNRETRKLIEQLHPESLSAMEISGTAWGNWMHFKSYTSLSYQEYDVCAGARPERYDLIIAEQVFEHLLWPYRAGKNVYQMLNPGGHFLVTTPFLVRIHNHPVDCSRWTELGMKHFLAECGFPLEKTQTGAWGSRACIKSNFLDWTEYRSRLHSLRNEPQFPMSIWALAQKPPKE